MQSNMIADQKQEGKKMKVTYWKNVNGEIRKYYGENKPFCGCWWQVTEADYIKSLQIAWANYNRK